MPAKLRALYRRRAAVGSARLKALGLSDARSGSLSFLMGAAAFTPKLIWLLISGRICNGDDHDHPRPSNYWVGKRE